MRKSLRIVVLLSLSLLLVMVSGMLGCSKEEKSKELVAPQITIRDFSKEATIIPADANDLAAKTVVVDMALMITNPNDFEICAESFLMKVYVDGLKLEDPAYTENLYVPSGETVTFHKVFVFQPMAVIINLMGLGESFEEAMPPALAIWDKVTADTATWDLECVAAISSEWGDLNKTYQLSWTMPSD
jgi:hypothetical protein